jgi:hypothetical protein
VSLEAFPGLTHREPLLDETDFERFVAAVEPLMHAGRDVLWVPAGRTDSSLPKVKTILAKHKMNIEVFYLCYNTKQTQQYGYWKRQRGIASSKSLEQAFYVYTGKVPKHTPKNRMFVDPGSSLFNQVVNMCLCSRQCNKPSSPGRCGRPASTAWWEFRTSKTTASRIN